MNKKEVTCVTMFVATLTCIEATIATQRMLDAMQLLMTGSDTFDPVFFQELQTCMDDMGTSLDLRLVHVRTHTHVK